MRGRNAPSVSEGSPTEGRFAKQRRKRPRAGRGVFKAILSPEGRRRKTTFQSAPMHHTPRSACGLSFKGTSLGLRLDLTASWYPPREASPKGRLRGVRVPRGEKEGQLSRGAESRPSQPDERKSFYPTTRSRVIEREARVSRPKAANSYNGQPSTLRQRREPPTPAARVSRGVFAALGRKMNTTLMAGSCEARVGCGGWGAIPLNRRYTT